MTVRKKLNHDAKTREKIKTSQIINALHNHLVGKWQLSATQIRAAEILLKKTLPDLSAVEHSGAIETRTRYEYTDAELADIIARGRGAGDAAAAQGSSGPDSVH